MEIEKYKCPECNGTLITRGSFRDSMGQMDSYEHKCDVCDDGFMYKATERTKYYQFTNTGKVFLTNKLQK